MAAVVRGRSSKTLATTRALPKGIARKKIVAKPKPKRTSQGLYHKPKNKDSRKNWKRYRGQGPRRK